MKVEIDQESVTELVGNVLLRDYSILLEHDCWPPARPELLEAYKIMIAYYTTGAEQ